MALTISSPQVSTPWTSVEVFAWAEWSWKFPLGSLADAVLSSTSFPGCAESKILLLVWAAGGRGPGQPQSLVTATAGPSDLDMSEPQAGLALHCQHCLDTRAPRLSPHHQRSQRPQESCSWGGKEGVRAYIIVSVFLSQVSSAWGCPPQDTGQQGWNRPGAPKHWGDTISP